MKMICKCVWEKVYNLKLFYFVILLNVYVVEFKKVKKW